MPTNDIDERLEMKRLVDEEESQEEDGKITSQTTQIKKSKKWPYLGIILAAISAIFLALMSATVKWMVNVYPIQLSVFRFTGVFLPAAPIAICQHENPFPKGKRLLLLLRSFSGATGIMLGFYAFRHMPLGDAFVLAFSFPVFVAIYARLFLKEPCGLFHVITIILTLFGIILISRPPFIFRSSIPVEGSNQQLVEMNMWGPVAAFSSALLTAFDIVLLRSLKGPHFSVAMVNYGVFSSILSLTIAWGLDELCWPRCGVERLLTVALAVLSFGGQMLMTISLKIEQAGPIAIARTTDIVISFFSKIVFFQMPNRYSIAGAFLVTSSILLNGIRTWVLALPETSTLRKRLFIFEM